MLIILKVLCIVMSIFNFCAWVSTEIRENDSCSISSAIYFLCFILLELFGG